MPEEIRNKGFIRLLFDKYENEYFIVDHLNHHSYWFKSYGEAVNKFEEMAKGIK